MSISSNQRAVRFPFESHINFRMNYIDFNINSTLNLSSENGLSEKIFALKLNKRSLIDLFQIIFGACSNTSKNNIFCCSTSKQHTHTIKHLQYKRILLMKEFLNDTADIGQKIYAQMSTTFCQRLLVTLTDSW